MRHSVCSLAGCFGSLRWRTRSNRDAPLFNLDGEHMVVELGRQVAERHPEVGHNVGHEWEVCPMLAIPQVARHRCASHERDERLTQ